MNGGAFCITKRYKTSIGNMTLIANDDYLVACHFEQSIEKRYPNNDNTVILQSAIEWLDSYFKLEEPPINELSLLMNGTAFQKLVWQLLMEIPFGETVTYKEVAIKVSMIMNKKSMSAQAVGNAISKNKFLIVIPCHRVIGSDGKLIGYSGGVFRKIFLLEYEARKKKNFLYESGGLKWLSQ